MAEHRRHHGLEDGGAVRLAITIAINLCLTVAQVVGGLLADSFAIGHCTLELEMPLSPETRADHRRDLIPPH